MGATPMQKNMQHYLTCKSQTFSMGHLRFSVKQMTKYLNCFAKNMILPEALELSTNT